MKQIVVLLVLNLLVAIWANNHHVSTVYVLTPFVDVIPESVQLSTEESNLLQQLPTQAEARSMQQAYARLGSTLSVHDILRGIDALEHSSYPLRAGQKNILLPKLLEFQEKHRRIQEVQRELIQLEYSLRTDTENIRKDIQPNSTKGGEHE